MVKTVDPKDVRAYFDGHKIQYVCHWGATTAQLHAKLELNPTSHGGAIDRVVYEVVGAVAGTSKQKSFRTYSLDKAVSIYNKLVKDFDLNSIPESDPVPKE